MVPRRALGRTGLSVPQIGFGCGTTAGLMVSGARADRLRAVARALELGIDYFDTAPVYGDGASEAHLGEAFQELGVRPVVATKVALGWDDLSDIRAAVLRSVEASLSRLRLDRIDVVQLHNRVGPTRAVKPDIGSGALITVADALGPVADAFRTLRDEGRASFFGCCAFGGDAASVRELIASGEFDAMLVHYSLANTTAWAPAPDVRDYGLVGAEASVAGMGTIALRVLEAGRVASAEEAIGFVLRNAEVSTALVGFSNVSQIEAAARACS